MEFHSEHNFEIIKAKEQFGLTFSEDAYEIMINAIFQFIGEEIKEHWCTKRLKVKVLLEGQYEPNEKVGE